MRIAVYNSLYPPLGIGGAERSVQYLAEALHAKGHEILVVSQGVEWTTVRETINGIRVVRMGSPPGFAPNIYAHISLSHKVLGRVLRPLKPRRAAFYVSEIEKFKPDVVHSNAGADVFDFWRGINKQGVPIVHTLRNPSLICGRRKFAEGRSCRGQCEICVIETQKRRKGTAWVTGIVGISDFILQEHLVAGYFHQTPHRRVIPNSYATQSSQHVPRKKGAPLRIGYLGRLHETKGVKELILAMRDRGDRVRLTIAGTGNPEFVKHLNDIAGDNVEFLGFIEAEAILNQLDALAVPSLWNEPFGRVYAEAMVHGVPVIGSIFGAGPELVQEGKTGWLCDPSHPTSLRAAIDRCLSGIEKGADELRQNCLQSAQRFSVDSVAESYEEVYRSAIEQFCVSSLRPAAKSQSSGARCIR